MDKEIVLVVLLIGLVVLGGVQAMQINSLKSDFGEGNVVSGNVVKNQPTQQRPVAAQVPAMVGGC